MKRIIVPSGAAVMFVKCKSNSNIICNIPDIISGKVENTRSTHVVQNCVRRNGISKLDLSNILDYYRESLPITLKDFYQSKNKMLILTVELKIEEMLNLQYVLTIDSFLKQNNIMFYLILDTSGGYDTYYKLAHYFGMRYMPLYNNIYIKDNNEIKNLPHKNTDINYGEVIPFLYIGENLYKCCYSEFCFDETILHTFINNKIEDIIYDNVPDEEKCIINYIYGCISRIYHNRISDYKALIEFINKRPDTPILAMFLFIAIIYKVSVNRYDLIYENAIDYAFGLEQLIENSYFYADGGVFSLRIHKANSYSMRNVCKENASNGFVLEISLIDFQKTFCDCSLVTQFIKHADVEDWERVRMKTELDNSDGLKHLFQPKSNQLIASYYKRPKVIVQHYGLLTISALSRKANALLCVKSGEYFYTNKSNDSFFENQLISSYNYKSGVLYRIVIPIKNYDSEIIYVGVSNNKYNCNKMQTKELVLESILNIRKLPKNRKEKNKSIEELTKVFCDSYVENKIHILNAELVSTRLQLEYMIKALLNFVYKQLEANKHVYVAIIGIKNKTLIKVALRFISLCYLRSDVIHIFENSEIFICSQDCSIEVLIAGKDFKCIVNNVASQRVFGVIDDELYTELATALYTIKGD